MALTDCDWQLVAVALTEKGDDTAAEAVGLLTIRLVGEGGEDGVPLPAFGMSVVVAHPVIRSREAKQAGPLKCIRNGPVKIAHGSAE